MSSVYDTAFAALEAGISVFPIRADGSKKPAGYWSDYQQRRAEAAEVEQWFGSDVPLGLAFITGRVSENLELLEFEAYETYLAFRQRGALQGLSALLERLDAGYCERSPRGGIHWLYRCPEIAGNTKLATRPKPPERRLHPYDRVEVLIETRGEGGYVIVAPSGGSVHATGRPYELLAGGVNTIPVLTPAERSALFALAREFSVAPVSIARPPTPPRPPTAHDRPGDRWAAQTSWAEILTPHGWTEVATRDPRHPEVTYWCRPGKSDGTSATTNYEGSDLLKVFSTSTPFDTETTYSKFAAFALLNHHNDFAAATRALVAAGFGDDLEDVELVAMDALPGPPPSTPPPAPPAAVLPPSCDPTQYPCTDTGNAELLIALFGDNWRFDHRRGLWMEWAGHWWQPDVLKSVIEHAKKAARIRFQAAQAHEDQEFGETIAKFARQSENAYRLDSAIKLARSMPQVSVRGDDWDANPWRLGCLNGVIDLPTGQLIAGRQEDLITQHVPWAYNPDATCPRFERFLREITCGDVAMQGFLERAMAYTLTGDVREQKFFACWGAGGNGKSTLINVLQWVLGLDPESGYARTISRGALQESRNGIHSHDDTLSGIVGKRLVTASELSIRQLDTERAKAIAGGDLINTRRMRAEPFDFRPVCKLWLSFNRRPEIQDDSSGFWRKMLILPFRGVFDPTIEPDLEDTLKAELPGILAFLVRRVPQWLERGLSPPSVVAVETRRYREDSDQLAQFVSDALVEVPGAQVPSRRLFAVYQMWARDQGIPDRELLSANAFGRRMGERFERNRSSAERYYSGIEIRNNRAQE